MKETQEEQDSPETLVLRLETSLRKQKARLNHLREEYHYQRALVELLEEQLEEAQRKCYNDDNTEVSSV